MNKLKLITGMILFGSLWGFSECIIGNQLSTSGLPSGGIMTGVFAVGLMVLSRLLFQQRGMQIGMGVIAASLKLFNPFGSCVICSAIAIGAEAIIFESLWYYMKLDFSDIKNRVSQASMGIITGYVCYVGGFITTQILTPVVSSAGFYVNNLIVFVPQMLSRGLLPALLGGITIPVLFILKDIDVNKITDKIYYPITASISLLCWIAVIGNYFVLLGA